MPGTTPVASFENSRFSGKRGPSYNPNKGGGGAKRASLTTAIAGANNDHVITALNAGVAGNSIRVQHANPSCFDYPGRLVSGGIPAAVTISPSAGTDFRIIAKNGGVGGNLLNITLVDPGGTSVTAAVAVSGNNITVTLDQDGGGLVLLTAATLIVLLNANPAFSRIAEAYITETSTGVIAAVAQTFLTGGTTESAMVYTLLKTGVAGAISQTAIQLRDILNASSLVSAAYSGADDGTGTMAALAATSLAGGVDAEGRVGIINTEAGINDTLATPGDVPVGHSQQNNKGVAPARQQDILTDRVPLDATIIAGKNNQEVQQTSASTTRS